jgi:signal transduction histidine kinase/CheY-like chemotaxis protein
VFSSAKKDIKTTLLDTTKVVSKSIHIDELKTFTLTDETYTNPEYIEMVETLMAMFSELPNKYAYMWIMTKSCEDTIRFLVDLERDFPENVKLRRNSEPLVAISLESIGLEYVDITSMQIFHKTFREQISTTYGPMKDEYGRYILSATPIVCPETNETVAIFGIDFAADDYYLIMLGRLSYPIIVTILLIMALLLGHRSVVHIKWIKTQRDVLKKLWINYEVLDIEINELTDNYARILKNTLNVDEVSIWLVSDDKVNFVRKSIVAKDELFVSDKTLLPCSEVSLFIQILQERKQKSLKDLLSIPEFVKLYKERIQRPLPKSMLVTTITNQFEIIGMVAIESIREARHWSLDEENFIEAVIATLNQIFYQKEKMKIEKNLAKLNTRFINTFESMTDGFMYFTHDLVLKYINQNTLRIFEIDKTSTHNAKYWDALENIDQGDSTLIHGELWSCIPLDMTELVQDLISQSKSDKTHLTHSEYFESLQKWIEFRAFFRNGETSLFFNDITKRKEAEKAVIENQRLSAISDMANSFSHDFNNYLQVIMLNVEVLNKKLISLDEVQDYLKIINLTTNDAATRVSLLQRFSGTKHKQSIYSRMSVNEIIKDAIIQSRPIWKTEMGTRNIDIEIVENLGDIPSVNGNENEMRFIIYSLISNSVDAMPNGGKIDIETKLVDDKVIINIIDTGEGMDPEVAKRVFEPFFTTKGYTFGKGLGLSGVLNIITEHEGTIRIAATKKGVGTTIEIILPANTDDATANEVAAAPRGKPRILWVDDEALIREVGAEMLEGLGYEALTADGGAAGLALLENEHIDIIVSDIGMPEMDGWQFLDIVNQKYPGKYILTVVSGWGSQITDEQKDNAKVSVVMSKPVKLSEMKAMLENLWK